MASSGGPAAPPSLERVVGEAFVKAGQVILESRIYRPKSKAPQAQGRAWFNLEVDEVEGASKALERWRRETGLPLVLEVFLQPWGAAAGGQPDKAETLLERWVVHYYPMLPEGPSHLSRSQISRLNPSSVYKRLVITLRSLYTYVRVLPAYRMYRACKRQRGSNFTLGYRLHSTLPGAAAAAAPGARRMQSFRFGAVDTPYGQLRIGVDYQPATTVTILEQTTSPPPLPQIIADYVGGPAARGGGSGRAPLRHAMSSAAEGWGAGRGPSPPTPTHARQQRGALASPQAQQQQQQQQAGGSPGGGAERPGGMPIRRSWSASMRGASPHRAPTYPPADLPSPASPHDSPYGSTPQAVSLPAMMRALSTPTGKYAAGAGSPGAGGRPPLAKPPRAATAPLAAAPGPAHGAAAGPAAAGGGGPLGPASLGAAAAPSPVEGEDDDGGSGGASPCGSAGSGARQSSAPVCIPGRGGGAGLAGGGAAGRRLRSSGDLWSLQQAARMHKPLSAPAVSHMQAAAAAAAAAPGGAAAAAAAAAAPASAAGSGRGGGRRGPAAEASPSPPPAPRLPLVVAGLESESSGSAASSLYPTSCSPQLPFAFTPSAQSVASFGGRGHLLESGRLERVSPRLGRTLSGAGGAAAPAGAAAAAAQAAQLRAAGGGASAAASPGGGGGGGGGAAREGGASTALIRRPSWSSRSSAFGQLAGEASQQGVGYSVSPMQDAALDSMLAGSTPRQFALAGGLLPPLPPAPPPAGVLAPAGGGVPLSRASSAASAFGAPPPLLTFPPPDSPQLSGALDEADVLPFALDEGSASSPLNPRSPAPPSPPPPPAAASLDQLPVSTPAGGGGSPLAAASRQPAPAAGQGAAPSCGAATAAPAPAPAPAAVPAVDGDAAVGAFVRLIQGAPPLRMQAPRLAGRASSAELSAAAGLRAAPPGTSSGSDSSAATCLSDGRGLTLQAGLRQFSRIRERLQQRGVLVGPWPAEA